MVGPTKPQSAGVLVYRRTGPEPEVLLVHPGGPFWRSRDRGAWQFPKGLIEPDEEPAQAERREAQEELGIALASELWPLGIVRQKGGKVIECFAAEQDFNADLVRSNTFKMEWPRGSGRLAHFPEVDVARWLPLDQAAEWALPSQIPFLERLGALLRED